MKNFLSSVLMLALCFGSALPVMAASEKNIDGDLDVLHAIESPETFAKDADSYKYKDGDFMFEKIEKVNTYKNGFLNINTNEDSKYENYVKEILVVRPITEEEKEKIEKTIEQMQKPISIMSGSGSGSAEMEEWDKTGSISAYIKVEYTLSSVDGHKYVKLSKVSGGNSGSGSGVTIKSQSVTYGCTGFYSGGYQNKSATYSPSGKTAWSVTAPSSWKAVSTTDSCKVGGNYSLKVGRGNSTWNMSVVNNVFDN